MEEEKEKEVKQEKGGFVNICRRRRRRKRRKMRRRRRRKRGRRSKNCTMKTF